MTARATVIAGPAHSGKTARVLARYREALARRQPGSTLWLAPTWRSGAAARDALLGGQLAGCLSPNVVTFSHFAEMVVQASPLPVRALGRGMKRLLLRHLIDAELAAGRIEHFRPIAHCGGLVDLVGELIAELKRLDIWPDQFREACQKGGISQKDTELWAIYNAYQDALNEHQLYDAEGRFWVARQLLREGRWAPLADLRLVVADGFTDFTSPQHEIFEILAGHVDEILITLPLEPDSRRPDLFAKPQATLAALRRKLPGVTVEAASRPSDATWPAMAHLQSELFTPPRQARPGSDTAGLEIVGGSGPLGEIEEIGRRIKRVLTTGAEASGGKPVRPGDAAVVFRTIQGVEALVREVFTRLGIPMAIESGRTLEGSMAMAALVRLVRLDVEDWPFRELVAVLSSSYFQPDWPEWAHGEAARAADRVVRRLQIPRGRKRLLEQLKREASREPSPDAGADVDAERRAQREARRREARAALGLLRRLAGALDELPRRAGPGAWGDAWRRLASRTGLLQPVEQASSLAPTNGDACATATDEAAWERLQESLHGADVLARWLGEDPPELDRRGALAVLLETLSSTAVPGAADETGRVRVLSAPSVRGLDVPYLFLAGLSEQAFPLARRRDQLYSDAEHRRLIEAGLPLAARTERTREEMLLFYEAATRASRQLTFSFPALDEAAQPLSPSPYLEEVEQALSPAVIARTEVPDLSPVPADDDPLGAAGDFRVKAVATALAGNVSLLAGLVREEPAAGLGESLVAGLGLVEARQDRETFGPAEGILREEAVGKVLSVLFSPQRTYSATELEQYATCPFRFFAERVLGLEPLADLTLAVDYMARGLLVHRALALLHQRINEVQGRPASPAELEAEDYQRLLEETLAEATADWGTTGLEAALAEVDRRLWQRWGADYRRQHEKYDALWKKCDQPLRPELFEVSFGRSADVKPPATQEPLELDTEAGPVRFSGRIDRIDLGTAAGRTVFNVLDYKTGGSTRFSPEAVAAGTALQLPLYVMAARQLLLADRDATPWQAGYWYVRGEGFKPRQAMTVHLPGKDGIEADPAWEAVQAAVRRVVPALVQGIRAGRFPVHSQDDRCTSYCPLSTVCRINQVRSLEKTWEPLPSQS